MDPVGFVASLLTLGASVYKISKAVKAVHSGLNGADKELEQASQQLGIIRSVLEQLTNFKSYLESDDEYAKTHNLPGLLNVINTAHVLLVEIEGTFPQNEQTAPTRRRLRWVFKDRTTVARILSQLDHMQSLLAISLQLERLKLDQLIWPALACIDAKQDGLQADVVLIKQHIHSLNFLPICKPSHLIARPTYQHVPKTKMKASIMRKWLLMPGIMILYCHSAAQIRGGYSVFIRAVLPGSRVVFARLTGFWHGMGMNLNIRLRNLIPVASEVIQACKSKDVLKVRDLLQTRKAQPNDITETNETLLMFAIEARSHELVGLLLSLGADSNMTFGRWQTSPLHVAFQTAQLDIARQLIRHGADIEYLSARGWSVISYLWEFGETCINTKDFYDLCSAQSFNAFDAQDTAGWTCLHRAAAYGTGKDIQTLLQLGAPLSLYTRERAWSPVHVASAMNNASTLAALARQMPLSILHSSDANGWTPLHIAVERRAEQSMRFLLRSEANPHAKSNITATWFPAGLEDKILTPEDLARDGGEELVEKYFMALQDAGWDVTVHGEEIFWAVDDTDDVDGKA